jgi:hypothetical protein
MSTELGSYTMFDAAVQKYLIECGRDDFPYSKETRWRTWQELNDAFQDRIRKVDFYRGLVLKDRRGNCWAPELRVVLRAIP